MNIKIYKKISTTGNYFLNKKEFWFLKYINFFSVPKYHPYEISVYDKLINKKTSPNTLRLNDQLFKKIKKYFNNIFDEVGEKPNIIENKRNYKTVILSNINIDHKKYSTYKDIYYGELAKYFKKDFLFVYRNYLPQKSSLESRLEPCEVNKNEPPWRTFVFMKHVSFLQRVGVYNVLVFCSIFVSAAY